MNVRMRSLRQRLLFGSAVSYGPLLMSDSPIVAELLALTGYDHVIIDHEHSPTDVRSGQRLLQAIQAAQRSTAIAMSSSSSHAHTTAARIRPEPIVRVPSPNDDAYIKKVLDTLTLPGGILVPIIDDVETARAVARATRDPRQRRHQSDDDRTEATTSKMLSDGDGIRGCAAPFVRGSSWGYDPDYVRRCREDLLVMVQVETSLGVESIPDIAAVPGIDAIFLGPFDLSASIGKMGRFDDPEVVELIAEAEEAVRQYQRDNDDENNQCLLAGFRPPGRDLTEMVESGYRLICGSVDIGLLREAAKRDLETAANAIASARPNSSSPAENQ